MSARNPMVRPPGRLPVSTPTTPVLPMPRWTSMPQACEFAATRPDGAVLLEADLGVGVDVVANGDEVVLEGIDKRQDGHHGNPSSR